MNFQETFENGWWDLSCRDCNRLTWPEREEFISTQNCESATFGQRYVHVESFPLLKDATLKIEKFPDTLDDCSKILEDDDQSCLFIDHDEKILEEWETFLNFGSNNDCPVGISPYRPQNLSLLDMDFDLSSSCDQDLIESQAQGFTDGLYSSQTKDITKPNIISEIKSSLTITTEDKIIKKGRLSKDFRNFDYIIRSIEIILKGIFGVIKEKTKEGKTNYLDVFDKFLKDYDQNSKKLSGKFAEAGKEIYDIIKKLMTQTKEELGERLLKCHAETDNWLKRFKKKIRARLKLISQDLDSIFNNCERVPEYTYANFINCTLPQEILRRLILIHIAKDFIITEDMDAEFQNIQGGHGRFILSVLGGKRISLENRIRLLDFNCESTKHVWSKLVELESQLREKLKNLGPDHSKWIEALDESLSTRLSSQTVSSDPFGSTQKSLGEQTRSQILSPFENFIEEKKAQIIFEKPKVKIKDITLDEKRRALNANVDKLLHFIRVIEKGDVATKNKMKGWLFKFEQFLRYYWPHLFSTDIEIRKRSQKASKGNQVDHMSETKVDKLSEIVAKCLYVLTYGVNLLKQAKKQRMQEKKDPQSNLEKRVLLDPDGGTEFDGQLTKKKLKSSTHLGELGKGEPNNK